VKKHFQSFNSSNFSENHGNFPSYRAHRVIMITNPSSFGKIETIRIERSAPTITESLVGGEARAKQPRLR
jgi:hypothetical protein